MSFVLPVDGTLSLRLVEPRHAEELYSVIDANRDHIGRWLPWVEKLQSSDDERAWLARVSGEFAAGRMVACSILERGAIVGGIGTLAINAVEQSTEVGYWLIESAQGRGIMTRACRAFVSYLFDELKLHRVTIRAAPGNTRSVAVIERLGLRKEGELKQAGAVPGGWVDLYLYATLADEWKELRHG